jgi:hypothetical protein
MLKRSTMALMKDVHLRGLERGGSRVGAEDLRAALRGGSNKTINSYPSDFGIETYGGANANNCHVYRFDVAKTSTLWSGKSGKR